MVTMTTKAVKIDGQDFSRHHSSRLVNARVNQKSSKYFIVAILYFEKIVLLQIYRMTTMGVFFKVTSSLLFHER